MQQLKEATWPLYSGCKPMRHLGAIQQHAKQLQQGGICISCSTYASRSLHVRGTRKPAQQPQEQAICMSCSGSHSRNRHVRMTSGHAELQLEAAISRSSSGSGPSPLHASGMCTRVKQLQQLANFRSCSGCEVGAGQHNFICCNCIVALLHAVHKEVECSDGSAWQSFVTGQTCHPAETPSSPISEQQQCLLSGTSRL